MKMKGFLQNSLLSFCSVVFILAALEAVLRILPDNEDSAVLKKQRSLRRDNEFVFYKYDRFLGWRNNPSTEGYFTMPDSTTFVKINSRGLRDKEYLYDKQKGVFRILVLGDSFTWGYGVELEEIFTERLENVLGGNVEVLNAGVTGYGTDQELLFLEQEGLNYKPDVVLVALADNDYMWDNKADKMGYYPKPRFIVENQRLKLADVPLLELAGNEWEAIQKEQSCSSEKNIKEGNKGTGLKKFLKNNTKIYPFFSRSLKNAKYGLLRKIMVCSKNRKTVNRLRSFLNKDTAGLQVTKALFLRMKEDTQEIGARLIVFIVPYKSALEKLPNSFIDEFMDFFKQNDIPCLFPYEKFLRHFQRGEKLYLDHDDHWSPRGHALAAEELCVFLKKQRLVPLEGEMPTEEKK